MGNLSSFNNKKQQPNLANWTQKEQFQSYNVWSSNANPLYEIEQYPIYLNDSSAFQKEKQIYYLRKDHSELVAAKYFKEETEKDFCSSIYKGTLFLERIPLRLSSLKDIPFPDVIHFLNQILKGAQILANQDKPFLITEDHIGVNQQGIVKIWQNTQFQKSFPSEDYCDEQIMVRKIIQIVDTNTAYNFLPPRAQIMNFFYKENQLISFSSAFYKLDEYANNFNQGQIPDKLDCVARVGGIEVLKNQQKAYEERNKIGQPVKIMACEKTTPHPSVNYSKNMTQIPRQQASMQRHEKTMSMVSKPQTVHLEESQIPRKDSPQFQQFEQYSSIKPHKTIIQRLSQQAIDQERKKSQSLYQARKSQNFAQNLALQMNQSNSNQANNYSMQRAVAQSVYHLNSQPQQVIKMSPQIHQIETSHFNPQSKNIQMSNQQRNLKQIPQQLPQHLVQISRPEFKPLTPQQVTAGVPIERFQSKKRTQASQFKAQHEENIRKQQQMKDAKNQSQKFTKMRSSGQQEHFNTSMTRQISEISSINPTNQAKKSYYVSQRPFSQLRGESINNSTVNFYNNFGEKQGDSHVQWQEKGNLAQRNYVNTYPTIPQQLKQENKDYIQESPANTIGSGVTGVFSFGNQKRQLKDGTSSQQFLSELRAFKSYSPEKKQIQQQYKMLYQQQKKREDQKQRLIEQKQVQKQNQFPIQRQVEWNPRIVYSSEKGETVRQFQSGYNNQNNINHISTNKYQLSEISNSQNKSISPVTNRRLINPTQGILQSASRTQGFFNNQGRVVDTVHSLENSPDQQTPDQKQFQGLSFGIQNSKGVSLDKNLDMKYSITQDESYQVEWDPQILADLHNIKLSQLIYLQL